MAAPEIPIDVDPATSIWSTDGLPMMYLPRHFMVNMQKAVEAKIGPTAYRDIVYGSSHLSALQWCRAEAKSLTQKSLPRLGVEWFTLQINGCMVA